MKSAIAVFFVVGAISLTAVGSVTSSPPVEVTRNLTSLPLAFTENQGQWDEQVSFRANAGGATMWFTSDGAVYQFTRTVKSEDDGPFSIVDKRYGMMPDDMMDHQPDSIESIAIKANFVGANPNPRMIGLYEMEYKCNYFIGNDPNEWHTDVANYNAIVYEDIYSGIDLKYYGNGKQMEYDFIVEPGADYSQIEIQYEGAESISINDNGELVVETKWGEVVEQHPVIYQVENNSRVSISGEYRLTGDNTFSFELGSSYNPALPLVIDPVLVYSTYLGGIGEDVGYGIAVDGFGNAYITGYTYSSNFPTEGEYQTFQGGYYDAFVTKLNSSGSGLVYSTYLGGNDYDLGYGIAVDGSGSAYITGITSSSNFPTEGEYQTDQGDSDAFVTKLNSSGNGLVYSTYLGGSSDDVGRGIAVDGSGSAYITGHTSSSNFPTEGEYQTDQGDTDAFVTKLNSSGNGLVYSTYLGGNDGDLVYGIAVDSSGSAYVTGHTYSTDFPTQNPYQTFQGDTDAFVTKLNSSGNDLVYSTYLGGSIDDYGYGIAVDGTGSAYVTGRTESTDFPTLNPYQTDQRGYDAFVTKLSSSGDSLVYSTYLGGNSTDYGSVIAVDGSGSAYVTGYTFSSDFPTLNPYQTDQPGGDAFVTKLSSSGNSLVYSTYLGGNSNDDYGHSIAVDGSGSAYVTGQTESTDFPTLNPYQTDQGNWDAFVTKFDGQVGPSSLKIMDGAQPPQPIANRACSLYRVDPGGIEVPLGEPMTDADGIIVPDPAWFSEGDMIKAKIMVHRLETHRTDHDAVNNTAHRIFIDNATVQSDGPLVYEDTYSDQPDQQIILDHTTVKYNLVVAVQWDATPAVLQNIVDAFRMVANYLYDVTDGQATLDSVAVYDCGYGNPSLWKMNDGADVKITAMNFMKSIAKAKPGYFGMWTKESEPKWQCVTSEARMPRALYANYKKDVTELTNSLGIDWTIDMASRNGRYYYYPGVQGLAHELAHYLFYFGDEYFAEECSDGAQVPDYQFGLMDAALKNDPTNPSHTMFGEMSSVFDYSVTNAADHTHHGCTHGGQSCWEAFEAFYELSVWNSMTPWPEPCWDEETIPQTNILRPSERSGQSGPFLGPNHFLEAPDVDCGAEAEIWYVDEDRGACELNWRLWHIPGIIPDGDVYVELVKVTEQDQIIQQGFTSSDGRIPILGATNGDVLRAYKSKDHTAQFAAITVSSCARGAVVETEMTEIAVNQPMVIEVVPTSVSAFMVQTHFDVPFSAPPQLEVTGDDGATFAETFSMADSIYESSAGITAGESGHLLIRAVDDSLHDFFIPLQYNWTVASSGSFVGSADSYLPGCDLSLDSTLSSATAVLITEYEYPHVVGGIPEYAARASSYYSVSVYPDGGVLPGANSLSLIYDVQDTTSRGLRELRMYRWNTEQWTWVLVPGTLDTASSTYSANITEDGVFVLAHIGPGLTCGDINAAGDGVDISDLIYLVDYIFRGGSAPLIPEDADLDASGSIDISDLVYLIDYMFNGGPAPVCP